MLQLVIMFVIVVLHILPTYCEFTKVNLHVYNYDPARFNCDAPPDNLETYGYNEWRYTTNECNGDGGESGPNVGPPSVFFTCSSDGLQATLDFYGTPNCNGVPSWTMVYPTNEIVCDMSDENLGYINITCEAESKINPTTDPIQTTNRVVPNCNYYYGQATNECIIYDDIQPFQAYQYVCLNERTIESRFYSGNRCHESELQHSFQDECGEGCYCGAAENECDIADVNIMFCNDSRVTDERMFKYIIDECVTFNNTSHSIACDNGHLMQKAYTGSDCSGDFTELTLPQDCDAVTPEDVAATCVIHETEEYTTTKPTATSRLCTKEYEMEEYNGCGIFQFNGGCEEHFKSGALIFQDKSGKMSYSDCCAKCNEMSECKSFLFGKKGVKRRNWCNIYSVECTDNGDTDWLMFTPINNADVICNTILH